MVKKFSKKEIKEQIEAGDSEHLGWKRDHYLGAIAKIMFNKEV